jgi:hypothetical protein
MVVDLQKEEEFSKICFKININCFAVDINFLYVNLQTEKNN